MITITRSLARQSRAILRALRIGKSSGDAGLVLQSSSSTLRIMAVSHSAALEYRHEGKFDNDELSVPLDLLDTCEGRKSDPIKLEAYGKNKVLASWTDHGIPQMVEVDEPPRTANREIPAMPESLAAQPPEFLQTLRDATTCTDHESHRYALGCLQLRGPEGKIVATDGRQILVQSGFSFPWANDILVPGSGIFACRELSSDERVTVGATDDWFTLGLGPWTIWLRIEKEGRFPKVEDLIRPTDSAISRLSIAPGDAEFLTHALPRLPNCDVTHNPITLDLNGQVLVRGKPEGEGRPTELFLSQSCVEGQAVLLNTNREFLRRAVRFGFRDMAVFGPETPVQCDDGRRQYLWALLDPKDAIGACDDALRIESPAQSASVPTTASKTNRRRFTVTHPPTQTPSTSDSKIRPARSKPVVGDNNSSNSPIAQAMALRTQLRETLSQTGELIRSLKRQKRQSKLVASTLASLKELQKVAG